MGLEKTLRRMGYYARGYARYYLPDFLWRMPLRKWERNLTPEQRIALESRVEYYCRLPEGSDVAGRDTILTEAFRMPDPDPAKGTRHSGYFFDLYPYIRQSKPGLFFRWLPGDIYYELDRPTLVKSRPVSEGPTDNVICRLNSLRHFNFVADRLDFSEKRDIPVSRNAIGGRPWREELLRLYIDNPHADFGATDCASFKPEYLRPFLSIEEQLRHKFIMTLQGNDVATNLKWVMSSNSIAVMPRPTVESWYMEGKLLPNVHYIEISPDYSDLFERLEYFLAHPAEAREIIENAHQWVNQFRNPKIESLAMAGVLDRYFRQTGQIK
ncbi:MAG: lipopolysaccharide A protein [Muribaculaceae bacterium]|nr:lipopolysaccharide A protein [Muribaculaceae bacterium]